MGVVAVAALFGINVMQQNSDPAIVKKRQDEAEREARKTESKKMTEATQRPGATAPIAGADAVAGYGAEMSLGEPGGKPDITVTWEWTPTVQGNPSSVYAAVESVKKVLPNAAITVVNADAKPGAKATGIYVNGKLRVSPGSDGTFPAEPQLIPALMGGANK